METSARSALPRWFWIIVVVAIVWNLLGVAAYILDVTASEEALATLPDAERALYEGEPPWVTGAYAIAVFAGLAGSILLALGRSVAVPVLVISLAALLAQMFYTFAMSDALAVLGASSAILPAAIVVIGAALVWLGFYAQGRDWLR